MVAREERILRPRGEQNYAEVNSIEEAQVEVVDSNMNAVQQVEPVEFIPDERLQLDYNLQVQEAQRLNDEREFYVLQRIEEDRENVRRRQQQLQWEQEHQEDRDLQFAEAMVYDEDSLPGNGDDNSNENSSFTSSVPKVPVTPMTSLVVLEEFPVTSIAPSVFEKSVVEEVERRLRQRPVDPLSSIYHHRADVNKTFQSLDNKKESQSILQFIRLFNLHKDGYDFSDAQMKIQLYKKVGNKEKTHLELINFEQVSFTFEDIVDSLVVEFEGVSRVEDAVRAFTLFSPHEGESFSELKTRLKEVLVYLKRVGGSEHIIPCFMVLDTIRRFLPNQYQNYMAQLNNSQFTGLDEVGIVDLVFGHLAIFDLNRSFRFRQNNGRFNQRGRAGRGYSNYRGRASRGINNRQRNQSQHGNRSLGSNID